MQYGQEMAYCVCKLLSERSKRPAGSMAKNLISPPVSRWPAGLLGAGDKNLILDRWGICESENENESEHDGCGQSCISVGRCCMHSNRCGSTKGWQRLNREIPTNGGPVPGIFPSFNNYQADLSNSLLA